MARESTAQKWLLCIISIVAAIGGLLFGYDTGVISGAILYIKKDFAITIRQEELIIGIVSIGAVFGAIAGGPLSDLCGRKKVVLASSLLFIISAAGLSLSKSVHALLIWRFIVGVAIGISSATAPLYIAELAPRYIRGALVTLNQLAITVGILVSYLIGLAFVKSESWRWMFLIAAFPAFLQFVIMSFFPESPRYLTKIGKTGEALRILTRFRGSKQDAKLEIEHIQKLKKMRSSSFSQLFSKRVGPAVIAGVGLTVIQQITGINTIIYYAPTIFEFSGYTSAKSALLATTWVGIVNVVMTFLAIYLIDKVGRKPLLQFGLAGMILSLILLGLSLRPGLFPKHLVGITAMICLFVYIGSFAYSLGPGGWLINSEIYPLHIRGKAMGIATCANWLSNFIITSTFLNMIKALGKMGTFWIYALLGILGMLFVWRRIPETKAKSLEEIEEYWKK